jgi:hypothetical protein
LRGKDIMDEELREIEVLTRELFNVLDGLWSQCRSSLLRKSTLVYDEQGQDL